MIGVDTPQDTLIVCIDDSGFVKGTDIPISLNLKKGEYYTIFRVFDVGEVENEIPIVVLFEHIVKKGKYAAGYSLHRFRTVQTHPMLESLLEIGRS